METITQDNAVVDNPGASRFYFPVDGAVAVAHYEIRDGRIVLTHTEVPQRLSGRGVGSALAGGVFETIRRKGGRVIVTCPFMAAYASRHPEYADLLDG